MEELEKPSKRYWVKKASSFAEAEESEDKYYQEASSEERLRDIQLCREQYFLFKGIDPDEIRKGLRRVLRIIKQK